MAAEDYREFLAIRVLSDCQPITYRLLSRALKVNVNVAKQMLYEFHTRETAKRPKSVHATYLLTGKKGLPGLNNTRNGRDGDDIVMRSSPFMSSLPGLEGTQEKPVSKTSIVLVREEELEKTKNEFETITSIHIYSLEPGPLENLTMLTTCNQEIASDHASGDPLELWRLYGSIRNPYVKRRTTKHTPSAAKSAPKPTVKPTAAAKEAKEATKETAAAPAPKESVPEENKSNRPTPQPGPAASLKRSDSKSKPKKDAAVGNLFKSFAKAKPKAKEPEKPKEDDAMQGMSEDEGDDDDEPAVKFDEEKAAAAKKAREDREKKLKEMMEADVDMPDAPAEEENDPQDAPIDKEPPSKPAEKEAVVISEGGRRRGRRRVMQKKKVKDEDGYLVTKEEFVWESFSEDEPEPKKLKPTPKPTTAKGKKGPAKGQGSIASFFKKA